LCAQCYVSYDNEEIELRLLDVVQRKVMSYTLQDLRCGRCKEIMRENMAEYCECAGAFETLISNQELRKLLTTFLDVADGHDMALLKDYIKCVLQQPQEV
jgi:DNA polymerase epsilon subunit 1